MKTLVIGFLKKFLPLIFLIGTLQSHGQFVEGYGLFKHWHIGLDMGITSFIGDMSKYDLDVFKKINYESDFAMKGEIGKEISPIWSVRGQLMYGKLTGERDERYFKNTFLESTGHLLLNITSLLNENNSQPKYNFYVYGGVGLIQYRSIQKNIDTDKYFSSKGYTSEGTKKTKPLMDGMATGGGIMRMNISHKLDLTIDLSIHATNSDYLDALSGGHAKYDMFTYLSVGLTYKIFRRYKMWKPQFTKKHKSSMRSWNKNRPIFTSKKKGTKNLGNTFAFLKKY